MVHRLRRVLVIEDDLATAEQVTDSLRINAYSVDLAADGEDKPNRALTTGYLVMTADRLLPRIDGLEVIRRLRERAISTPALIFSALGEIDERVRGLRAGGDDYLVKPFASREMLARVEALARRSATIVRETMLRIGDLEIDLLARVARRHGRELPLLPREFKLLEYLVRNAGEVVSRAMLLQNVWDLHFDPLDQRYRCLCGPRASQVDSGQAYPLIHTISRRWVFPRSLVRLYILQRSGWR